MNLHDDAITYMSKTNKKNAVFESHSNDVVLNLLAKLHTVDDAGTNQWEKQLDKIVELLFAKWEIFDYSVNKDAYTGLVLECKSQILGDVVLKIYPPLLSNRFVKEYFIISTLTKYPQVPLIDADKEYNAMLLGRIIPGDYIVFEEDKHDITEMFKSMEKNKLAASDVEYIPKEIKGIIELTEDEFNIARKYDYYPCLIEYLFECAKKLYNQFFLEEGKYILHGDAYFKNVLRSSNTILAIDPVGYVDAFIFEYMPFLTYELTLHTEDGDYLKKYLELKDYFSLFTDVNKFDAATFVFLVKQLIPSIYEANDGFKRADKYLEVLKTLFLDETDTLVLAK